MCFSMVWKMTPSTRSPMTQMRMMPDTMMSVCRNCRESNIIQPIPQVVAAIISPAIRFNFTYLVFPTDGK